MQLPTIQPLREYVHAPQQPYRTPASHSMGAALEPIKALVSRPPQKLPHKVIKFCFGRSTYNFIEGGANLYIYNRFIGLFGLTDAYVFAWFHNRLKSPQDIKDGVSAYNISVKDLAQELGLSERKVRRSLDNHYDRGSLIRERHGTNRISISGDYPAKAGLEILKKMPGVWIQPMMVKQYGLVKSRFIAELHYSYLGDRSNRSGKEWAKLLGISRRTFWSMVSDLKIPPSIIEIDNQDKRWYEKNRYKLSVDNLQKSTEEKLRLAKIAHPIGQNCTHNKIHKKHKEEVRNNSSKKSLAPKSARFFINSVPTNHPNSSYDYEKSELNVVTTPISIAKGVGAGSAQSPKITLETRILESSDSNLVKQTKLLGY
jgi:biotin operon repressor